MKCAYILLVQLEPGRERLILSTESKNSQNQVQIEMLDNVVKQLRITLKNSRFYHAEHPIYIYSINNLKTVFDKWLSTFDHFEVGFTPESLMLGGEAVHQGDEKYVDVARFFNSRGIVSISIHRPVEIKDLNQFFNLLTQDRKVIQESGGIASQLPPECAIEIQEIDYKQLLQSSGTSTGDDDTDRIWQFLFKSGDSDDSSELPEDKKKFLVDFFSDVDTSVKTLNHVYREAVSRSQDEEASEQLKVAITELCKHFEEKSDAESREIKVKLMHVISQLHPDLINILLERTQEGEAQYDLVEAITKDFSETEIAEFIESLIGNEDTFNENLLKVFDKLAPDANKSSPVVAMVANRLFSKRIVNPDTLSNLQMSIREIFKKNPESNFMNEIYKITVDAVVNRKVDTLVYVARLSPLINKFVQSIENDQLKKEELWLLLNILWLENDAQEFSKFTEKITELLPDLLDEKDNTRLKEIVEFFTEKTRPEQRQDKQFREAIQSGLSKITDKETVESLIDQIPDASRNDLNDIAYILNQSKNGSVGLLLEAFLVDKNRVNRNKFFYVFSQLEKAIINEVTKRIETCEPEESKDLFLIIRKISPKKAHLFSRKMMRHDNVRIRWEALNGFKIQDKREQESVFDLLLKEKHAGVMKQATRVLLQTQNPEVVQRLFKHNSSHFFIKKGLVELVEMCGQLQVQSSEEYLVRMFDKRGLFKSKSRENLRVAALNSLFKLRTPTALERVDSALEDKSKRVREMSEILLKFDEAGEDSQ